MKKVLIIDDYMTVRMGLKLRFRSKYGNDVSVFEAGDLKSALELMRMYDFDYVISDLRLPDSDIDNTIKVIKPLVESKRLTWLSSSELLLEGLVKKEYDYFAPVMQRYDECTI